MMIEPLWSPCKNKYIPQASIVRHLSQDSCKNAGLRNKNVAHRLFQWNVTSECGVGGCGSFFSVVLHGINMKIWPTSFLGVSLCVYNFTLISQMLLSHETFFDDIVFACGRFLPIMTIMVIKLLVSL